jgi:hypothetical protein
MPARLDFPRGSHPRSGRPARLNLRPTSHRPNSRLSRTGTDARCHAWAGTFAIGISSDASTIVGYAWVCPTGQSICTSSGKTEAFRWTVARKYQVLRGSRKQHRQHCSRRILAWDRDRRKRAPMSMLFANAVTPDRSVVVGGDVWWNTSLQIGPFSGNQDQTQAFGVIGTANSPVAVGAALKGSDANGRPATPSAGLPLSA